MVWNSALIVNIKQRRKNEQELAPEMAQREDSLLKLMSRSLYGEKVHYALELIQNAEDAGSNSITFIFEKDKIIVVNDGEVFSADDVDAICSVKPGRKKNKIGFFGVGFKSVFNVTDTPQVISSDFNFAINNFIYPSPIEQIPDSVKQYYSPDKGSLFVLPQSEGLPTIPELIDNFKEIDDKILLFLNKLKALHFIDKVNDESWSIEKPPSEDEFILLKDGRTEQETKWRVFYDDLTVSPEDVPIPEGKEGITDTRIIVAFPYDEATQEANKGTTLYCYLPTKKRSDMPFLVQADFVPTVGRSDIQDFDWNKWLLSNLGILAANAIDQIKNDENLNAHVYNFIPLKDEVQEPMMDTLSDSMYDSLESKEVAKTIDDEWKCPDECVIAASPQIPEIIVKKDLHLFLGKPLNYIAVDLPKRAENILADLGSLVFDETEVVDFLGKEDLIKNRKEEWFLKVYEYLADTFDVKDKDYEGNFKWSEEKLKLFSKLEKTKFLLTNQRNIVPLKNPEMPDRLICFPQNIDLSEVNSLLTEGELVFLNKYFQLSTIIRRKNPDPEEEQRREKVREFFEAIGVRIYFKQSHVIRDAILPKFSSGKYKQYDDFKIFSLLNYIRNYWSTLESEVKNKKISANIFDEIKQTVRLRSYKKEKGKMIPAYLPPGKIYFPKRYGKTEGMEDLFEGIEDVYFLSPYYINKESSIQRKKRRGRKRAEYGWKKFTDILGVWSCPRVEKDNRWVSIARMPGYQWITKEYSPSGLHDILGNSFSEDIEMLIEYCSKLENREDVKERMALLWQTLSDNWKIYSEHCQTQYKYKYNSEMKVPYNTSSFLEYLRNAEWVPTEDGSFCKPEVAVLGSARNRMLLGKNVKYTNLTGNQGFIKKLGITIEPDTDTVIDHLKEYKETNPDIAKSEIHKFKEIYSYLSEKINNEETDQDEADEEIRKGFEENELLYIPRKDKSWWKPYHVFWKDHSKTFGNLRGYIEINGKEIYPHEIRDFLFHLGVRENLSINQALDILEELKQQDEIEALKRTITKVYIYINDLVTRDSADKIDWKKYTFLTKKANFETPNKIFYEDEPDLAKYFQDKADFIYTPHSSWNDLHAFLNKAGIKSFKGNLSIKKHLNEIKETEGGEVSSVLKALSLAKKYLLNKNIEAYDMLQSQGTFDSLPELEVYETSSIKLDLFLNNNESGVITINGIEKDCYYSEDENRLYILEGNDLLSGQVAKELSRIFKGSAKDVFPFLNVILPIIDQDEELEGQLSLYGLENEMESYSGPEKIELLPEEEKPETEDEQDTKTEEEPEGEKPTVKPPTKPKPRKGLIDPNEFFPTKATEYTPYKANEGDERQIEREINLREGKSGTEVPYKGPKLRAGTGDAEPIALQIVVNYESNQGREAEDRHSQKGIGYDIYSKIPDGDERFIEVKHFADQDGRFKIEPHQIKKAEIEGDKYFIYIVKGLKEEINPKIFIIQNPIKWLTPDPPIRQEYSEWKNAVNEEIEFEKA